MNEPIQQKERRTNHVWRWRLVYIWIIVFTAFTVYITYRNHELGLKGIQTHAAICTFRADLNRRIDETEKFFDNHPHGVPGIASRADLITSLHNQKLTYKSLSGLDCNT